MLDAGTSTTMQSSLSAVCSIIHQGDRVVATSYSQPTSPNLSLHVVSVSGPPSPYSSVMPSPPESPSSVSVSSLPSVSSSFFFSSRAASPPAFGFTTEHPCHADMSEAPGLIIPSLALPEALRRPTLHGKTLGTLRLLVFAHKDADPNDFFDKFLSEDNDHVVDAGEWEDAEYGRVRRASTDWIEHRDGFGLEKFEPTRNIEVADLGTYDHGITADMLLIRLKPIIHAPFYAISDVLDPSHPVSPIVSGLVSSSSSPLYTALIWILPPNPSTLEKETIDFLGDEIPIIVLPSSKIRNYPQSTHSRRHPTYSKSKLSSLRFSSLPLLRTGIFASPETISVLRCEAADRFLHWYESERTGDKGFRRCSKEVANFRRYDTVAEPFSETVDGAGSAKQNNDLNVYMRSGKDGKHQITYMNDCYGYDGDYGESDSGEGSAPHVNVNRRLRENTLTQQTAPRSISSSSSQSQLHPISLLSPSCPPGYRRRGRQTIVPSSTHMSSTLTTRPPLSATDGYSSPKFAPDPLHLPSLVMFSLTLLNPLRVRIASEISKGVSQLRSCIRFSERGSSVGKEDNNPSHEEVVDSRAGDERGNLGERQQNMKARAALFSGFLFGLGLGMIVGGCWALDNW